MNKQYANEQSLESASKESLLHNAAGITSCLNGDPFLKILVVYFCEPEIANSPPAMFKNAQSELDVHFVCGAAEANAILRKSIFDCVLLDGSPDLAQAFDFLSSILNPESDQPRFPTIMIIDHPSNHEAMLNALRRGAEDCIAANTTTFESLKFSVLKAREHFETKASRNLAEIQLQQLRRMDSIGQLTSGIAHDFNNLLTVVLGNTRLLRRRIERNPDNFLLPDADQKIESIEIAATKGADLVRRMMVFTRQSKLSEEIVDLNTCVNETFELLKRTLGEQIKIDIIAAENLWSVSIDVREFENALINLAVNARDSMPRGGRLIIETGNVVLDESYSLANPDAAPGPYVCVSVSDSGCGIDPEVMARIFEPFFTTKEAGQGTGLGLSMVYGFIRQSKGHIHAYSEVGHGTVFRIYLPKARHQDETLEESDIEAPPSAGETILVVEDDEDVRFMACAMLGRLGYKTLEAPTGKVALEIIKKQHKKIDLVFTDIVMPGGMTGIELVQRMREYYPAIKVLYTSGYSANAIPDYQLSMGEELISKPYRREALARKLREIINKD